MADQNFWFPSQTGSIYTPAGDMRIKIFYDDGTAADNTDVGADIKKISPLSIPLEVSSSGQSFRHGAITIDINNPIYDSTNNVFEQHPILINNQHNKTFITIYIDGSEIWRGIIDFDQISKQEYYVDGSDLKYRSIKLKCYDPLWYFWKNDTTLSGVSYADGQTLGLILYNITTAIGLVNDIDSNIHITEENGNTYSMSTELRVTGIAGTTLVRDFLKQLFVGFGLFGYCYKGTFYVVSRIEGFTTAITNDYIVDLSKITNGNPIDYIRIQNDRDWSNECANVSTYTHHNSVGSSTINSSFKYDVTLEGLLEYIYTDYGAAGDYPSPAQLPTAGTIGYLDDDTVVDFYTNNIESGMVLDYCRTSAINQNRVILDVPTAYRVTFPAAASAVDTTQTYFIDRSPNGIDNIYKIQKIIDYAVNALDEFFTTSPDLIKIRLRDISEFDDFTRKFVLFSNNHRAKNINIYFNKDELTMELVQVA